MLIVVNCLATSESFPSIEITSYTSFAAFSVARTGSATDLVSTYLLYQDATGKINQVYATDNTTWHISQPSALAEADNGTDIACLTMATIDYDSSNEMVFLGTASGDNRCYYQRDGNIVEVKLDGTDWIELTTLPE